MKTIILTGGPQYREEKAGGAVTPGHLVAFNGAGALIAHATAGGNAAPCFAVEAGFLGRKVDTAYAVGENAHYATCPAGTQVYAWLAAGANVAKGAFLESAGNGALRGHVLPAINEGGEANVTIQTRAIVARALEAVNNGAGAQPVRIIVEVV